jgi:Ulp1 family protease
MYGQLASRSTNGDYTSSLILGNIRGAYNYNYPRPLHTRHPLCVLDFDQLILPINIDNNHWILIQVNMTNNKIICFDSFHNQHNDICVKIAEWLQAQHNALELNQLREWTISAPPQNIAMQTNGYDCGVYVAIHMYQCVINRYWPVHDCEKYRKILTWILSTNQMLNNT